MYPLPRLFCFDLSSFSRSTRAPPAEVEPPRYKLHHWLRALRQPFWFGDLMIGVVGALSGRNNSNTRSKIAPKSRLLRDARREGYGAWNDRPITRQYCMIDECTPPPPLRAPPFCPFLSSSPASLSRARSSCLNNVILAKGPLLRSGWKTVLTVLRTAARDPREEVRAVRKMRPPLVLWAFFVLVPHPGSVLPCAEFCGLVGGGVVWWTGKQVSALSRCCSPRILLFVDDVPF